MKRIFLFQAFFLFFACCFFVRPRVEQRSGEKKKKKPFVSQLLNPVSLLKAPASAFPTPEPSIFREQDKIPPVFFSDDRCKLN